MRIAVHQCNTNRCYYIAAILQYSCNVTVMVCAVGALYIAQKYKYCIFVIGIFAGRMDVLRLIMATLACSRGMYLNLRYRSA